ncbi:MAG: hypothetical protein WBD40_14120 [Tepidisphaeraceae bacterium]
MTYRGRVKNGAVVLDPPAELPEGAAVEVNVVGLSAQRPPITSIEQLRGDDVDADSFGDDFDQTLRKWRKEPWRSAAQEPLE